MTAPPNAAPTAARKPAANRVTLDAALVRAHQASVWRYLRFLGCPSDAADDLTQETFLALLRSSIEDRGPRELDAWLRAVARNLFRARRRAMRRGLETLDPEQLEAMWTSYARDDAGDGFHDALRVCLASLDERSRLAVELRYRDDATRPDIARALGVSDEGAKTLLRRAKGRLRACIERRIENELT